MSDPIVALALLKANFDQRHLGYLDNFNRLTAECLRESPNDIVSAPEVQRVFRELFGLHVPLTVVESLLKRAVKKNLLKQDQRVLRIIRSNIVDDTFRRDRERAAAQRDDLIRDVVAYANEKFSRGWTREQADNAFQDYLSDNQIPLFRSTTTRSLIRVPQNPTKRERYIFATYVNKLILENSPYFEALRVVVEGNLLANAILLPAPDSVTRRFKSTAVFFDTRVILRALGYAGSSLRAPCVELFELLYDHGAGLCVFSYTFHEAESVLRACARSLRSDANAPPGFGETFDYFQRHRFRETDVHLLAQKLEDALAAIRVTVQAPPSSESYMIDEAALKAAISSEITYKNEYALDRDVKVISAVIRIRKEWRSVALEESRAIFVTINNPLRYAANDFYRETGDGDPAPIALSEWALANLLWLKRPTAASDLPRKQIAADFFAAVQPTDEFRRRFLDEIDKLQQSGKVTAEDVYLLAHTLEAQALAFDRSIGDEDAITQGTIEEVLDIMRADIEASARQRAAAAEATAESLRDEVSRRDAVEAQRRERADLRAMKVGRGLSYVPFLLAFAAVIWASYIALPSMPIEPTPLQRWLGAIFSGLLTIVGGVWGATVIGLRRSMELLFARWARRAGEWASGESLSP
jgi:hypothetical protein